MARSPRVRIVVWHRLATFCRLDSFRPVAVPFDGVCTLPWAPW